MIDPFPPTILFFPRQQLYGFLLPKIRGAMTGCHGGVAGAMLGCCSWVIWHLLPCLLKNTKTLKYDYMRCGVYVGPISHLHFFFRSECPCEALSIGACCKQRKFRRTAFRTRLCVAQIRISSNLLTDFGNLPEETEIEILDVTFEMAPPKRGLHRNLLSFLHDEFKHLKSNGPISCQVQQASTQ